MISPLPSVNAHANLRVAPELAGQQGRAYARGREVGRSRRVNAGKLQGLKSSRLHALLGKHMPSQNCHNSPRGCDCTGLWQA